MRPPRRSLPAALLAVALLPAVAAAHEFWLSPSAYRAAAGDTIAITALVGTGFTGEPKPYARTRTLRFTLDGPKRLDLRPAAMNGELTFARFITADGGGTVVAYESDFVPIELAAPEFERYLRLEGLDGPLGERLRLGASAAPGRERYARCARTWIAGAEARRVLKPSGLTLELVPLDDPSKPAPLRLRLLYRGKPLAGALVRAWNRPLAHDAAPTAPAARDSVGPIVEARTGADGVVTLATGAPGEWMVSAVHMVPSTRRDEADWQSWWASLTFARPGSRR